jgi:hypothetical protein
MATNFITNTASLKTTIADVRKLDAKKINTQTIFLGGENIRDIIDNATPTIKHSQDTRETVSENDLWGQYIETNSDGTIIIHDDEVTNPNGSNAWNKNITKVENDKAYVGDTMWANIKTEKIENGNYMFNECSSLKDFNSDLSSLKNGKNMFYSTDIAEWNTNLPSLIDGSSMFFCCSNLTSFSSNLSSLTNGRDMFNGCNLS